jgi:hypothetical protein
VVFNQGTQPVNVIKDNSAVIRKQGMKNMMDIIHSHLVFAASEDRAQGAIQGCLAMAIMNKFNLGQEAGNSIALTNEETDKVVELLARTQLMWDQWIKE